MNYRLIGFILAMLFAAGRLTCQAQTNLLATLKASDLAKWQTRNAGAFLDAGSHSVTLTFRYAPGEAEVRIPVAQMGWPVDWSGFNAVRYVFHATSLEAVSVGFSDGKQTKALITEPLPGIRIQGVIPFSAFVQTRTMTPMLPLGYKAWPERLFTFERVEEVVFRMKNPSQSSQLTLYAFTLMKEIPADDILEKKPLIDRYGQWIPENWVGKANDDAQLRTLWDADTNAPPDFPFCALGGDPSRSLRATGFFRTERVDGKWLIVDPHGHPFYSTGMDLVGYDQGSFATDVSRREFLFEELPAPGPPWLTPGKIVSFYIANILRRLGEGWQEKWARQTIERLRSWGFNTIANWSDRDIAVRSGMAYVLPLSGWTTKKVFPFPYDFPDIFSREFEENVEKAAKEQCGPLKNDPKLIGWFIGNEPHWARGFGARVSWPDMLLADAEESATKNKLTEMLARNPSKVEAVRKDFLYTCAEKYFQTIVNAIRRHDHNHMILGIRFAENPGDRWAEMSRIFDTFSINIYSEKFAPDPERIRRYAEVSGKPVLIGEFTACTPGRGLQGLFYYVHKVRNHEERGRAYRYYVENSAADPFIIGTHWFQLVDDLPTGRPSDEERLNYGFVNVIDLPYPELVWAARQTHRRIYDLKSGKVAPYREMPRTN